MAASGGSVEANAEIIELADAVEETQGRAREVQSVLDALRPPKASDLARKWEITVNSGEIGDL